MHIEIVNITKNPLDAKVYTCLDVVRPEAPNLKIFSNNDYLTKKPAPLVEDVLLPYPYIAVTARMLAWKQLFI